MKQHLTLSLLTTALLTACGGVYNEHPAVDPPEGGQSGAAHRNPEQRFPD